MNLPPPLLRLPENPMSRPMTLQTENSRNRKNSANRKEAQAAQSAVTPVLETRLRGKASRQTTNMGDVNSYVRKIRQAHDAEPVEKAIRQPVHKLVRQFRGSSQRLDHHLRPLGFRARGLDASWPDTNFRGFFPKTMLDPNGEPVANLYTVTQVIEGSPLKNTSRKEI